MFILIATHSSTGTVPQSSVAQKQSASLNEGGVRLL